MTWIVPVLKIELKIKSLKVLKTISTKCLWSHLHWVGYLPYCISNKKCFPEKRDKIPSLGRSEKLKIVYKSLIESSVPVVNVLQLQC